MDGRVAGVGETTFFLQMFVEKLSEKGLIRRVKPIYIYIYIYIHI